MVDPETFSMWIPERNSYYIDLVKKYAAVLDSGEPFTQANYGDGEWACILGESGGNSNDSKYLPALGHALGDTLREPRFTWFGYNPGAKREKRVEQWLAKNEITGVRFIWKEILAAANVNGYIIPFIRGVRRRRLVLVGPHHLTKMLKTGLLSPEAFVVVPTSNSFNVVDEVVPRIEALVKQHDADLVLFSAGMATNVMMHCLVGRVPDNCTMLDTGAIWDPYAGHFSRKGYLKETFKRGMIKAIKDSIKE